MKKILLLALALVATGVSAKDKCICIDENCPCDCNVNIPKNRYINISFVADQKFKYTNDLGRNINLKSAEGGALEFGRTYFIRPRKPFNIPVLGETRLGIDLSYIDLQFNSFEANNHEAYFGNVGIQFGPSVTFTPVKNVNVRLYGHYAPSLAVYYQDENDNQNAMAGYAGYLTGGLHASWKFLTLGVELRGTTATLNSIDEDDIVDDNTNQVIDNVLNNGTTDAELRINADKVKVKLPGVRFALGFRF